MKNILVAYNGVTRLALAALINQGVLGRRDTIVLLGRGETVPTGLQSHAISPSPMRLGRNPWTFRAQVREFDRNITRLLHGDPFIAYVPGLFSEHLYALVTHPNCVGANFIEDGLGSLLPESRRYSRRTGGYSIGARLGAWGRFPPHLTDCSDLISAGFHFSPEAFPDWPASLRTLLAWPTGNRPSELDDIDAVISLERLVEANTCILSEYVAVLQQTAVKLQRRGLRRIATKAHPNFPPGSSEHLVAAIRAVSPQVRELPRAVTLEPALGPHGPVIVGDYTSLLHYSILVGGQAISYARLFSSPFHTQRLVYVMPPRTRAAIDYLNAEES